MSTQAPELALNCCLVCRFFMPGPEDTGECHRHAPRPHAETGQERMWPILNRGDWCGEWEIDYAEARRRVNLDYVEGRP